ncbi:hypothetical protein [Sphingomonas sp. 1P08PE]|uniref:hypothetical protein n=1 Tax=Sphingomonas sp. 1P08PE TaxID=554122 RepID=UPI0039A1F6F2
MLLAALILVAAIQTPPEQPAPPAVKEKKICRSQTATSSRLDVTRTCLTRAQWDERDRLTSSTLSRDIDRSRSGMGGR